MGLMDIVQRPPEVRLRVECQPRIVLQANGTYRRIMDLRSINQGSIIRYGDDIVILGKTQEEVQRLRQKLEGFLCEPKS